MKLFGTSARRSSARGFAPQKRQFQTFILEPILTPSGIVDGGDHTPDLAELPLTINDGSPDFLEGLPDGLDDTPDQTSDVAEFSGIDGVDGVDGESAEGLPTADTFDLRDIPEDELEEIAFVTDLEDFSVDDLSFEFESGVFAVGETGEVGVDFVFDGGGYQGELAIFSLEGMEELEPGSEAFIREAASRALSDSELGHIVIRDKLEGARFSGDLGEANQNFGDYLGVKTVQMKPGDRFGFMLVPNDTVQKVFDNPTIGGNRAPLFSMSTANPADGFHMGQIADVFGDGNTFVFEDKRIDGKSDRDYNDIIFQVRGATASAIPMDLVIDARQDWQGSDLGQAIATYTQAYLDEFNGEVSMPDAGVEAQPLIGVIDTGFSGNNPDIDYSRLILGRDRVGGDDNPLLAPGEGSEHGTHVLGIIGATRDNGIGIDGLNDDAPIWVGRSIGTGQWAESLVEYVDYFRQSNQPNGVVNLSLDLTKINPDGSVTTRYELTPQERSALEYARQSGVLVVVSSGNDGGVMSALGQASQEFDNILTVGAAERVNEEIAPAKAMDRSDYSSYGYGLDIVAPGSTTANPELSTVGDGLGTMAGTSVATAKVTGAISQVWAANPQLSYRQVIEILKSTATDLGETNHDQETGFGLLNMAAAILLAKATKPDFDDNFREVIEGLPPDEMLLNLKAAFENAVPGFGNVADLSDEDLDELTSAERAAYEEIVQELGSELSDYLSRSAQKLTLEYHETEFGLKLEAMEKLLEMFNGETLEGLIQAQDILQDQGFSADIDLEALAIATNFSQVTTNLDFIPSERAVAVSVPPFNAQILNAGYVSQVGFLRIRSGPGTNYAEVGRKNPGNTVTFDAFENNGTWVPDPYMPGGGSRRWYKIAGTNQWMSALYFNNSPELAQQERERQDAIRRAEEAARQAEEAARQAAEAAQRAAEQAQRELEEAIRREQEEAARLYIEQNAVPTPPKHVQYELLAKQLVYQDYSEGQTVEGYTVNKVFQEGNGLYAIGLVKDGQPPVLVFRGSQELIDWVDNTHPGGVGVKQYNDALSLGIEQWIKEQSRKGTKPDITGHSLGGALAQLTTADFSPWIGETVTFNAPGISVDRLFGFKGGRVTHYISQKDIVSRAGMAFVPGTIYEMRFKADWKEQHTQLFLSDPNVVCLPITQQEISDQTLGWQLSRSIPEAVRGGIGILLSPYHYSNIATEAFNLTAYYGSKAWNGITQGIKNGADAVGSFINEGILALQKKAQDAKKTADEALRKVNEVRQSAQEKIDQAKAIYQTFKQETQRRITEVVQISQQKIQQVAQKTAQAIRDAAPKVAQAVTKFVKGAVQVVSNIISTGKQILTNVINTGKQIVENVVNTGRQVVSTVTNFVKDTYNSGVKLVSETAKAVQNTVSNTANNVAQGFNRFKSAFGF